MAVGRQASRGAFPAGGQMASGIRTLLLLRARMVYQRAAAQASGEAPSLAVNTNLGRNAVILLPIGGYCLGMPTMACESRLQSLGRRFLSGAERWPSGRRRTPGKCVYAKSVSWVRIPPSPQINTYKIPTKKNVNLNILYFLYFFTPCRQFIQLFFSIIDISF